MSNCSLIHFRPWDLRGLGSEYPDAQGALPRREGQSIHTARASAGAAGWPEEKQKKREETEV